MNKKRVYFCLIGGCNANGWPIVAIHQILLNRLLAFAEADDPQPVLVNLVSQHQDSVFGAVLQDHSAHQVVADGARLDRGLGLPHDHAHRLLHDVSLDLALAHVDLSVLASHQTVDYRQVSFHDEPATLKCQYIREFCNYHIFMIYSRML